MVVFFFDFNPWTEEQTHSRLADAGEIGECMKTPLRLVRAGERNLLSPVRKEEIERRPPLRLQGDLNNPWVEGAIRRGVDREDLAKIVLERLLATPALVAERTFVSDFLEYGAGRISRGQLDYITLDDEKKNEERCVLHRVFGLSGEIIDEDRCMWRLPSETLWGVLNDEQFLSAAIICANKDPPRVVRKRFHLRLRLDDQALARVMRLAVAKLDLPAGGLENLATVPLSEVLKLARRINAIPLFGPAVTDVAKFVIGLSMLEGEKFYLEMGPVLDQINAARLYRNTWLQIRNDNREGRHNWLFRMLEWRLAKAGYVIAQLERGYFDNHAVVNRPQVRYKDAIYVQRRDSHRYVPEVGDTVIFRPLDGRRLTGSGDFADFEEEVFAVHFLPAHNAQEA